MSKINIPLAGAAMLLATVTLNQGAAAESISCNTSTEKAPQAAVSTADRTFQEQAPIAGREVTGVAKPSGLAVDGEGNLLICDEAGKRVCVVTPENTLKSTWALEFPPQAIDIGPTGTVVVGGTGMVALLGKDGNVLQTKQIAGTGEAPTRATRFRLNITSVGMNENSVFVAMRTPQSSYGIYRLPLDLSEKELVVSGLRGCCGQMNFDVSGEQLYVAANCNFKVVVYREDGRKLSEFGKKGRGLDGFGGCCEPKNVRVLPDGSIMAAESDNGAVKLFTADGSFVEEAARAARVRGCVRVTIDLSPDGNTLYMLDTSGSQVRTFAKEQPAQ